MFHIIGTISAVLQVGATAPVHVRARPATTNAGPFSGKIL
jgi:hypothetical protein